MLVVLAEKQVTGSVYYSTCKSKRTLINRLGREDSKTQLIVMHLSVERHSFSRHLQNVGERLHIKKLSKTALKTATFSILFQAHINKQDMSQTYIWC